MGVGVWGGGGSGLFSKIKKGKLLLCRCTPHYKKWERGPVTTHRVSQWLGCRISDQGVPGSNPGRCTFRCGLEQVTFTPCLVLALDERLIWTDCDEAGYYVVPNVLSPRDLVSRPDNMDETVPHTP